jgi:hypothetical protein
MLPAIDHTQGVRFPLLAVQCAWSAVIVEGHKPIHRIAGHRVHARPYSLAKNLHEGLHF